MLYFLCPFPITLLCYAAFVPFLPTLSLTVQFACSYWSLHVSPHSSSMGSRLQLSSLVSRISCPFIGLLLMPWLFICEWSSPAQITSPDSSLLHRSSQQGAQKPNVTSYSFLLTLRYLHMSLLITKYLPLQAKNISVLISMLELWKHACSQLWLPHNSSNWKMQS